MRGRIPALALAAAAVLAAGCARQQAAGAWPAGVDSEPVAAAKVTAAVANTTATSSKFSLLITVKAVPGRAATPSTTGTGEFDYARQRGSLLLNPGTAFSDQVLDLVPVLYVKADKSLSLPPGKSWIEITPADPSSSATLTPTAVGVNLGPDELLAALTSISGEVTTLGPGTIRKVAVTRYRVAIDLAGMAARLPSEPQLKLQAYESLLGQPTVPAEVWVDGQAMVRRVSITFPFPAILGVPAGSRYVASADYYDFNVPVAVTAPPPAEVVSDCEAVNAWIRSNTSVRPAPCGSGQG